MIGFILRSHSYILPSTKFSWDILDQFSVFLIMSPNVLDHWITFISWPYPQTGQQNLKPNAWQCPQIGRQYGIKNKAAITLQCKLNGKLIAALLFIPYSSLISGYSQFVNISQGIRIRPTSKGNVIGMLLERQVNKVSTDEIWHPYLKQFNCSNRGQHTY